MMSLNFYRCKDYGMFSEVILGKVIVNFIVTNKTKESYQATLIRVIIGYVWFQESKIRLD